MFDPNSWKQASERQKNSMALTDSLMGGVQGNIDSNQSLFDDYVNTLRSGEVPQNLMDQTTASVNRGLQAGMGTMLNNYSNRGVLNSSITSQGINNFSKVGANAIQDNYMNIWNSALTGYQNGMNAGNQNLQSRLGAVSAAQQQGKSAFEDAAAPLTTAYNFWKEAQASFDRREDYDTVVEQGK
jgi:hypothetical protein